MAENSRSSTVRGAIAGLGLAVAAGTGGMAGTAGAAEPERLLVQHGPARIEVLGEGRGPVILLLASLGRGAEDFDGIAPRLAAAGFRVIRPEPRGIGRSEGPMEALTLYDLAGDAAAAVAAEGGQQRVIVAGHAFGNWVARALAAARPELVRAVVLLAASVGTEIDPAIRASIDGSFDPALPEAERLAHLRRAYFAAGNDARLWLSGWHPAVARMQRAATAATRDRSWQRVAERVPVLYVAAAEDTIAPPPGIERLRQELGPQVSLATIAGAGHALLPEQPEATAEAIIQFARGLP